MKETVENLLPLERNAFFALNGSDSIFLDNVMWTVTGRYVWAPVILFLLFLFFFKTPWRVALLVTFFFVLVFAACDQISSSLFKPLFERMRPTHHPDFMNLVDTVNDYRGGGYSFISGHATNAFGLATFLSFLFRYRYATLVLFLWAVLNSYSRIYLGVHFISDVLGGMVVGTLVGFLSYRLLIVVRTRLFRPVLRQRYRIYGEPSGRLLCVGIGGYLLLMIIFSHFFATLPH